MTVTFETPSAFLARDEFDQAAGVLTGKTAPIGGVWAGAGATGDFSVETTGKTAQRTVGADTDLRYAISGVTGFAAQAVQVDCKSALPVANAATLRQAVLARYTDTNNWLSFGLMADVKSSGPSCFLEVRKRVAGTITAITTLAIAQPSWGSSYSPRLLVDANGRWFAWFLSTGQASGSPVAQGADEALASGGALASGKPGFYDTFTFATAPTRNYDNFFAFAPTPDAAIFA